MQKVTKQSADCLPGIGEKAPAFEANSSQGKLSFPKDLEGSWLILLGHVGDFVPSCAEGFAKMQLVEEEFYHNDCKLIALFTEDFSGFIKRYKECRAKHMPEELKDRANLICLVDDSSKEISRSYGILPTSEDDPDDIRAFFVIDNVGVIRTILMYHPQTILQSFDDLLRVIIALKRSDSVLSGSRALHVHNRVALAV
jgi:peroxiredoxin 2/4